MKVTEFVKKYGLDVAKDLASRDITSIGYLSVEHHQLSQGELKQIIDSFELVERFGGVIEAKKLHYDEFRSDTNWDNLQQAVSVVEQCQ